MKINIAVTAKDIRNGKRNDIRACPVALSLKRRGHSDIYVGSHRWSVAGMRQSSAMPARVAEWIHAFDLRGRKAVRPFRATLTTKGNR